MTSQFSRRQFLLTASALMAAPNAAISSPVARSVRPVARPGSAPRPAIPSAEDLLNRSGVTGQVSFAVARPNTGDILESHDAGRALPPASVAKIITALYALDRLGPAHRFQTRLLATGPIKGHVLDGDLVLAGGGDPTLDTDALADLARQLKQTGVHEIRGRFVVWAGALPYVRQIDTYQLDQAGYNPAISGLALNFNRVRFGWTRKAKDYAVTMEARAAKYSPEVSVARMKVVARDLPIYTYKSVNNIDNWTVARDALGKGGSRWLPVRRPDLYTAEVFRDLARSNGIFLPRETVSDSAPVGTEIARWQSDPLRAILQGMLKYSTNLTAEMVGLAATLADDKEPTSLRASANAMNQWAKTTLGINGIALVDHSGLGGASRVTAAALVGALGKAATNGNLRPILKQIHLRNEQGGPDYDHPIKVAAKTGTLNFVSCLAGYMTTEDGTELAFAIMTADQGRRAKIDRAHSERPPGGRRWNRRSKNLQQDLIERWGAAFEAAEPA